MPSPVTSVTTANAAAAPGTDHGKSFTARPPTTGSRFGKRFHRLLTAAARPPRGIRYRPLGEFDSEGIPSARTLETPWRTERQRNASEQPPLEFDGLTIARQLVEAHGGTIWAESEEGTGSRFGFDLPVPGH